MITGERGIKKKPTYNSNLKMITFYGRMNTRAHSPCSAHAIRTLPQCLAFPQPFPQLSKNN